MPQKEPFVLASRSPRRRQLLTQLNLEFEVIEPQVEEEQLPGEPPVEFAMRAAGDKGLWVATTLNGQGRHPWILAADTSVVVNDQVLSKPANPEQGREMLRQLSGRTHIVITGWTIGRREQPWIARHEETRVTFHELTEEQIVGYVATGEGMDKAGSYGIQGLGSFLVDRIDGNYFNVVGLPVSQVVRALLQVGAVTNFLTK